MPQFYPEFHYSSFFILKPWKQILNFRWEKKKSSLSSWLHRTANGDQSNKKGQNLEESTTTSLCYIERFGNTRVYLQYTDFELGEGRQKKNKIILDSLNYYFFYLTVESWIPVFKSNLSLLQAGPAPPDDRETWQLAPLLTWASFCSHFPQ